MNQNYKTEVGKIPKQKGRNIKSINSLFLQRKMWMPHIKNKDSVHM